jgi:hypothetical protein
VALLPILTPDVEVAQKLRRWHLTIPGEPQAFAYSTAAQAIDAILAHGFDEFVLHVGVDDYLCRPAQQSLFEDYLSAIDAADAPASLPSATPKEDT